MVATHPARRRSARSTRASGKLSSQFRFESPVARTDLHRADAARRPGNEQPSERRRDDHVADGCAFSAARVRRRSHPEHRRRLLVDAAARAIAGIIGGSRHAVPVPESGLERSDPAGVAVLTRRDSKQLLEGAKQMMRTGADQPRQVSQGRRRLGVGRDGGTRAPNAVDARRERRWCVGMAAPAGAEPGRARRRRGGKKRHAVAPGPAARTRRTAVHSRGRDRIDKGAVPMCIAIGDRIPK